MEETSSIDAIAIAGPTGVGKSNLAIKLASSLNGEIVNIDSVQVYKHFNIGSGKVSNVDLKKVKHHLINLLEPEETINAFKYKDLVESKISKIKEKGKLPILVVGTNLYFKVCFGTLKNFPEPNKEIIKQLDSQATEELYAKLLSLDSEAAKTISKNDKLRIVRALEIMENSGKSLTSIKKAAISTKNLKVMTYVLCDNRKQLYDRINKRVNEMLEKGLISEVENLILNYKESTTLDSLGYRETKEYIENDSSIEKLIELISQNTRRFSKRQMTFWRNEPKKNNWAIEPNQEENLDLTTIGNETSNSKKSFKGFRVKNFTYKELVENILSKLSSKLEKTTVCYINRITIYESFDS